MLLWIDEKKVEEELKKPRQNYAVSAVNCEPGTIPLLETPTSHAYSAVNLVPPDMEAARERLLALRQKIMERGGLVSGENLDRLIDETRGR